MSDHDTQDVNQSTQQAYEDTVPGGGSFEDTEVAKADYGSIAYELLLLQQRLAAYEQLHIEEMAELRREIERLRRTFLEETSPQLRAISPRNLRSSQ
jgi:hypothetical protein